MVTGLHGNDMILFIYVRIVKDNRNGTVIHASENAAGQTPADNENGAST
jgi:hypothetical protein